MQTTPTSTEAASTAPAALVAQVLAQHAGRPGALLPVLHDVQAALGHVPPSCVPAIAEALNLSRAEVHGVLSYYQDFRSSPAGRHRLRICMAEACQACSAEALMAHSETLLGCNAGATTADGQWTLEPVYCLGLCAQSPAVQIDQQLHACVTPAKLQQWLARTTQPQEAA